MNLKILPSSPSNSDSYSSTGSVQVLQYSRNGELPLSQHWKHFEFRIIHLHVTHKQQHTHTLLQLLLLPMNPFCPCSFVFLVSCHGHRKQFFAMSELSVVVWRPDQRIQRTVVSNTSHSWQHRPLITFECVLCVCLCENIKLKMIMQKGDTGWSCWASLSSSCPSLSLSLSVSSAHAQTLSCSSCSEFSVCVPAGGHLSLCASADVCFLGWVKHPVTLFHCGSLWGLLRGNDTDIKLIQKEPHTSVNCYDYCQQWQSDNVPFEEQKVWMGYSGHRP